MVVAVVIAVAVAVDVVMPDACCSAWISGARVTELHTNQPLPMFP